ncbi:MAG: hypothetical protein JWO44_1107 [Bacteroidetes bacterium]|nr:hypothetical protein [Bacteroidota bacterium]
MKEVSIFYLGLLFVIGLIAWHAYFNREATVKRKLKKVPGKKIADCEDGEIVKIAGKIKYVSEPMIAPLSGRKCVYYQVVVEENDDGWQEIIREETGKDVVITDGTHYALIETRLAKSYLQLDKRYTSKWGKDASRSQENLLKRHGEVSTRFFGTNKSLRYLEAILEENEQVVVAGIARWKSKNEISLPIPAKKVLYISHPDKNEPVYLSDDLGR